MDDVEEKGAKKRRREEDVQKCQQREEKINGM